MTQEDLIKAARNLMRSWSLSFQTGDKIDQEIALVLETLCKQNFASQILEEFKTQPRPCDQAAKQKYKEALDIEAATYIPIVKLSQGKYLIGTKVSHLQTNDKGCLVRTGGGFQYLGEYLKHHSRTECIELNNLIQKSGCSFGQTVVALMKKHYADNQQIRAYQRKCSDILEEQFTDLVALIKKFD